MKSLLGLVVFGVFFNQSFACDSININFDEINKLSVKKHLEYLRQEKSRVHQLRHHQSGIFSSLCRTESDLTREYFKMSFLKIDNILKDVFDELSCVQEVEEESLGREHNQRKTPILNYSIPRQSSYRNVTTTDALHHFKEKLRSELFGVESLKRNLEFNKRSLMISARNKKTETFIAGQYDHIFLILKKLESQIDDLRKEVLSILQLPENEREYRIKELVDNKL